MSETWPSRDDAQSHIFENGRCALCDAVQCEEFVLTAQVLPEAAPKRVPKPAKPRPEQRALDLD